MWTFQMVTHNTSLHINFELLLVSIMDCTMWILLCTLLLIVDIHDDTTMKFASSVMSTDETNNGLAVC
jgi:hypothetical protein